MKDKNILVGKCVIVRSHLAGVYIGKLEKINGTEIILSHARKCWYWKGAAAVNQLAKDGVKCTAECKFTVCNEIVQIAEYIEILNCTTEAEKSIYAVPVWTA